MISATTVATPQMVSLNGFATFSSSVFKVVKQVATTASASYEVYIDPTGESGNRTLSEIPIIVSAGVSANCSSSGVYKPEAHRINKRHCDGAS